MPRAQIVKMITCFHLAFSRSERSLLHGPHSCILSSHPMLVATVISQPVLPVPATLTSLRNPKSEYLCFVFPYRRLRFKVSSSKKPLPELQTPQPGPKYVDEFISSSLSLSRALFLFSFNLLIGKFRHQIAFQMVKNRW